MNRHRTSLHTATALVLGALYLSGCVSNRPIAFDGPTATPIIAPAAVGSFDPVTPERSVSLDVLGPDDQINVTVVGAPELSLPNVVVTPNGTFDMPGVGTVIATGRTAGEISDEIRARLTSNYLLTAEVSVNVVSWGGHRVTVEGGVTAPGVYQYGTGATLLDAIAMAKGLDRTARLQKVVVFRGTDEGRSLGVFDIAMIRAGEMGDPVLRPGDRVVVGFSNFAQGWQDFLRSAPILGLFTRF